MSTPKFKVNPLKKLAGQTAIYGLPTIVGRLLTQFLTPLYTYVYTTGDYGVVTSMYAYVSFLLVLLTYGMETALFRFSQKEENKDEVYSTTLISLFFSSIVFIGIAVLYSDSIASLIKFENHGEYIVWFALILGSDAVANITFAKLREQNKSLRFSVIKSINISAWIFLNVFFIWFCAKVYKTPDSIFYPLVNFIYNPNIGVGYIFISNLIASMLTIVLLLPDIFRVQFKFNPQLWKKMMLYGMPLLVAGLAGMVNETIDRILLTYLLPESEAMSQAGIYGACYKIAIIMIVFIQTFRFAAEPFFFSHEKEKDSRKTYADIMKYFVIVCSFIFLGTMMNISWIQYFVGEPFRAGLAVVPILLMANLCLGIFINQSFWYKLTGQTHFGAYLAIFGALITLVLNFYWIPIMGYMGSAWATLICYASMMVASYFLGNKYYPVKYELGKILGYIFLALSLYFVSGFILTLLKANSLVIILLINNFLVLFFVIIAYFSEKRNIFISNESQNN